MHSSISQSPIESADINSVLEFNQQLKQLVQAGIPLRWPADPDSNGVVSNSERAAKELALHVTQGTPLSDALRNDSNIPEAYKLSFATWYASQKSPKAFDILKSIKLQAPIIERRGAWGFYIKVLLAVAMVAFCIWQATGGTQLRLLYIDSSFEPGPIGRIAIWINENLWWPLTRSLSLGAILLFIVSLALFYFFFLRRAPSIERQIAVSSQDAMQLYRSTFVRSALDSGLSIQDASKLLEAVATPLNDSKDAENLASAASIDPMNLYAALWGREKRLTANLKNSMARIPYLAFVLVGGLIALFLAIGVYGPVFEFIYSLETEKRF